MIDMTKIPLDEPVLETIESVRSFEQVPFKEQFPYTNSYEIIMKSAELFGESTALEFLLQGTVDEQTQTTSFKELAHKVTQTANLLTSLGIGSENAVSIVLPILPQTHFAIWGAQAAGISNPINPLLEPEHMSEIISAAGSKVIICLAQSKHSDIWQKVIKQAPPAELVLAGKNMPKSIQDKESTSVKVIGEVKDAKRFIAENGIMVVPLTIGSGIRIKIIEGMVMGKAIVATDLAVSGIGGRNNTHYIVANTAEEIAYSIVGLLNNPVKAEAIGKAAQQFANNHFDNKKITSNLVSFYNQLLNQ